MNKNKIKNYNISCDALLNISFQEMKKYMSGLEEICKNSKGLATYKKYKLNHNTYIIYFGNDNNYIKIKIIIK